MADFLQHKDWSQIQSSSVDFEQSFATQSLMKFFLLNKLLFFILRTSCYWCCDSCSSCHTTQRFIFLPVRRSMNYLSGNAYVSLSIVSLLLLMAMLFVHSTWQHVGWELLYMLGFMLDYSRGWQSPRLFRYMALVWFIVMLLMLPRTSLGRTSTSRRWWRRLTAPGGSLLK